MMLWLIVGFRKLRRLSRFRGLAGGRAIFPFHTIFSPLAPRSSFLV
jgi:hypothetical protein